MSIQILLTDDDEDEHLLFRWATQRVSPELKLISAQSASAAMRILEKVKPSIIFLDITMPYIDGFTCLEMIKQKPGYNDVPVYFYSSEITRPMEKKILSLGAAGWIMKRAGRFYLQQCVSIILKKEKIGIEQVH